MRDFCTTPKHIRDMAERLIQVSIEQGNWMSVSMNASKMRSHQGAESDSTVQPLASVSLGLAFLHSKIYRDAAMSFIQTSFDIGTKWNSIIIPSDIAVYGGLCALACMDRQELQKNVLENPSFRNFLELESHIRRSVQAFVSGKYSECLSILETYKTDYLLDINLQPHIQEIYFLIRSKSIVQYFLPFSCVTLNSMAAVFASNSQSIAEELREMIQRGLLNARIDTQNQVCTQIITRVELANVVNSF
jgi:COP9 signalosome complex subunit 1